MTQAPSILLTRNSPDTSSVSASSASSSTTTAATTGTVTTAPEPLTGNVENGSLSSRSGSGKRSATAANSQRTQCYRTKLCKFFDQGVCDRGESCTYAHSEEQLRQAPNLRKTKLCNQWQHNKCPHLRAANCPYAHGPNDLRVFDKKDSSVDDENSGSTSATASTTQDPSEESQGTITNATASESQDLSSCAGSASSESSIFAAAATTGDTNDGTTTAAGGAAATTSTSVTAEVHNKNNDIKPSPSAQNTSIGLKYTNDRASGVWRSIKNVSEPKDTQDYLLGPNSDTHNLKVGSGIGAPNTTNEMSSGSKQGLLTYPYNKPKTNNSKNLSTTGSCCSNADDYYHHQRCLNSGDARNYNSTISSRWYAVGGATNGTNRTTGPNQLYAGGFMESSTATSTTSNSEDGHENEHMEEGLATRLSSSNPAEFLTYLDKAEQPDISSGAAIIEDEYTSLSASASAAYCWKADWDFTTIINASTYRLTFTAGIIHRYDD